MTILIHSHMFPSAFNPVNGTFVYYAARQLVEQGHTVVVISPIPYVPAGVPRKSAWYKYKSVPAYVEQDGIHVYYPRFLSIPKNMLYWLRGDLMYLGARRLIKHLFKKYNFDIIHAHVPLPDGVVAMKISSRYDVPFGVTVHGSNIYVRADASFRNYQKIEKVLRNAGFVGVVSQKLLDIMKRKNLPVDQSKTKVIYNGVNVLPSPPPVDLPNYEPDNFHLVTIAHAIKRKGIYEVLGALSLLKAKLPELHLYYIGDGPELASLKRYAREKEIENRVTFLGRKSNEFCLSVLNQCDAFVLPSWDEAFGVVYIEAMYYSCVTVGSLDEGIAEIIKHGENGFLVPAKDPTALANCIDSIVANIEDLRALRETARETVWPEFSWEMNANRYLEWYRKLADSSEELFR